MEFCKYQLILIKIRSRANHSQTRSHLSVDEIRKYHINSCILAYLIGRSFLHLNQVLKKVRHHLIYSLIICNRFAD